MNPKITFSKIKLITFLIFCSLILSFSLSVLAEQPLPVPLSKLPETSFQQDEKEFPDATLTISAGITPDSPFYFLDNLLDNFATDASNREEKIAEIRDMIKAGKVKDAQKALSRYQQFAKRTQQDISPNQQEQARKSAVAISHVMKEIKDDIPKEYQQEFVNDIITQEEKISTAAKVADKIQTLCETLSKLDPQQYAQTCKVNDNEQAPKWQRNLDNKLTAEQQQEAHTFFKTMSNCMRNPANCQCDEISLKPFAEKCKVIAPLAAKCNQGDTSACDVMDKDTENIADLLPPHLQAIMKETEKDFNGAQFENHMPPGCQQANIDPKSSNAREQCEAIMFKQNAPEECVKAGLKDHKECGKYMFNLKAPPECKDAGLTGESQNDPRQCEKIMQSLQKQEGQQQNENHGPPNEGTGQSFGKNCKDIADANEKLQCLEEFYNRAQQQNNAPSPTENQQSQFQQGPNSQSQYPPNKNNDQNNKFQNNYPNNFKDNFDPSRAPPECRDTKSPEECRKIMDEKSQQYQQENENKYRNENKESGNKEYNPNFHGNAISPSPGQYPPDQYQQQYPQQHQQPCDCRNMKCDSGSYPSCDPGSSSCSCHQVDNQQQPYPQPLYPDNQQHQQSPNIPQPGREQPNMISPPDHQPPPDAQQPPPQQSPPSQEQNPPPSFQPSQSSESKESSPETTPLTGNTIIDNKFLKFYWKK